MQEKPLDIRWKQRFSNYKKALQQLRLFMAQETLNPMEELGFIKAFEYTFELAWNVMKDFLTERGETGIFGSRDAIQKAFATGLISNGQVWMNMIKDRNQTSHVYHEETASEIAAHIREDFFPAFVAFETTMERL